MFKRFRNICIYYCTRQCLKIIIPNTFKSDSKSSVLLAIYHIRVAEEVIFGTENVTTGASNDFQQVSRVARQMVERFGFSKKIGQVALGGGGGNPFLGQQVSVPRLSIFERFSLTLIQFKRSRNAAALLFFTVIQPLLILDFLARLTIPRQYCRIQLHFTYIQGSSIIKCLCFFLKVGQHTPTLVSKAHKSVILPQVGKCFDSSVFGS